jgi:hypothetical protein
MPQRLWSKNFSEVLFETVWNCCRFNDLFIGKTVSVGLHAVPFDVEEKSIPPVSGKMSHELKNDWVRE